MSFRNATFDSSSSSITLDASDHDHHQRSIVGRGGGLMGSARNMLARRSNPDLQDAAGSSDSLLGRRLARVHSRNSCSASSSSSLGSLKNAEFLFGSSDTTSSSKKLDRRALLLGTKETNSSTSRRGGMLLRPSGSLNSLLTTIRTPCSSAPRRGGGNNKQISHAETLAILLARELEDFDC